MTSCSTAILGGMIIAHVGLSRNRTGSVGRYLPSLVYRRYRGDMIEVYKYLHRSYSLPGDSVLKMAPPSVLRGHDYKLLKRHCHSQLRLQFFSYCVVNLWNNLPVDVVSAPSLKSFKGRIDNYWNDYQFSLNFDSFMYRLPVISQKVFQKA